MADETRWRYLAYRVNGNGTETRLHGDVPLTDVTMERDLSGPSGMDATLTTVNASLKNIDGDSLFVPWSTAVYVEKEGIIRRGYILIDVVDRGADLDLTFVGWAGYPKDQPFNDAFSDINAEPLDIVRMLWRHLQGKPGGNIGMVPDDTRTPIRVGKAIPAGTTTAGAEEGPFVLGWWETKDLGGVIDELATGTPFDYVEEHEWDGEKVVHRLRFGYPTIGERRRDVRFVVGENVSLNPEIQYQGEDYATGIIMLGAGEGRAMIRGIAVEEGTPSRLRRILTLEDKSLTTKAAADRAAERELKKRRGDPDFTTITVEDHPNAQIGSYDVGDEIQILTVGGWHDGLDLWVRILAISTDPEKLEETLTVVRTEKVQ